MMQKVLSYYGLDLSDYQIIPFGSGLINHTWKVSGQQNTFILQRINHNVFVRPYDIDHNLQLLSSYLSNTHPHYIFAAPLQAKNGNHLIELDSQYFRLFPFVKNSHTVNNLTESSQAYEAALQFGKLTANLNNFDAAQLKYTITDFHNLNLRICQFNQALANANQQRLLQSNQEITKIKQYLCIFDQYEQLKKDPAIKLRVIHHDAKINNVLFDDADRGLAVIDLDTMMPGYFISDVGDMMRTYLAQANEEEQDLNAIHVRVDFFAAIHAGYLEAMGKNLTSAEKSLFIYSGEFMIYMQAVRFLTDFLNNDVYYLTKYEGQNLARAQNQLKLLEEYIPAKPAFEQIVKRQS